MWTGVHGQTVFPGVEEPLWYMLECLPRADMLRWSQSAVLATAMGQENVYLCFDTVKMAKVLTGIHERAGFPGLKELFSSANGYLVHHSPRTFLMSPLHSLSLKMWILVYYMP